jgi:hypothetical protein
MLFKVCSDEPHQQGVDVTGAVSVRGPTSMAQLKGTRAKTSPFSKSRGAMLPLRPSDDTVPILKATCLTSE